MTKLSALDIEAIGVWMKKGFKAKEIAPAFGITPERIWQLYPGY